jgi:hypothetical protein
MTDLHFRLIADEPSPDEGDTQPYHPDPLLAELDAAVFENNALLAALDGLRDAAREYLTQQHNAAALARLKRMVHL